MPKGLRCGGEGPAQCQLTDARSGVGADSIGVFDLCRDEPGMLSDEHLADAKVAADIAGDAVLYLQEPPGHPGLAALLETVGMDRLVVHQAAG